MTAFNINADQIDSLKEILGGDGESVIDIIPHVAYVDAPFLEVRRHKKGEIEGQSFIVDGVGSYTRLGRKGD